MRAEADPLAVPTFSESIRKASWTLHEGAESSRYMDDLFAGRIDKTRYADLVAQHHFIYEVLEDAAGVMTEDPIAKPFVRDELRRGPALRADLLFLLGDGWQSKVKPTPSTQVYCDRMREVCFDWAGGFVAHQYVRYLGDLSGGQVVRRKIERLYGITSDGGTAFYAFDEIPDLDAFKNGYRQLLNDAPWDSGERSRIIDEVLLAYKFNTDLLNEL